MPGRCLLLNQTDLKLICLSINLRRHTFYILGGKKGPPRDGVMAAEEWRGPKRADEEQRTVITISILFVINCDSLTHTGITRNSPLVRHASARDPNSGIHKKQCLAKSRAWIPKYHQHPFALKYGSEREYRT